MYEEGPVGLTRAFLMAGVRNLVAYNGKVDDSLACTFAKTFYEEWVTCREADTALRAAQIRMIRNEIHHDFWSGYKVIRQRVQKSWCNLINGSIIAEWIKCFIFLLVNLEQIFKEIFCLIIIKYISKLTLSQLIKFEFETVTQYFHLLNFDFIYFVLNNCLRVIRID